MKDIWTLRPGFYGEFRYKSYEHSGLAWGAISRKMLVLTLFPRLPCSFFQEHVPRMDSFPMLFTHPTRPPAPPVRPSARHGSQVIKIIGFPVFPGSQVIKMDGFSVFPGSQVIKMDDFSKNQNFDHQSTILKWPYLQFPCVQNSKS